MCEEKKRVSTTELSSLEERLMVAYEESLMTESENPQSPMLDEVEPPILCMCQ